MTPRDDFTNVERAATAYHGLWFDLDGNPATGIDGKEHQEHWFLPNDNPVPIAITHFEAQALDPDRVKLEWEVLAESGIESFDLLRATDGGALRPVVPGSFGPATRLFVDEGVTHGERYEYVLVVRGNSGAMLTSQRIAVTVPAPALALRQNAPNPFRDATSIGITIPDGTNGNVSIFDVAGRRVATVAPNLRAGEHNLTWDGTDDQGKRVGTGVYFYRLEANGKTLTRKLAVIR